MTRFSNASLYCVMSMIQLLPPSYSWRVFLFLISDFLTGGKRDSKLKCPTCGAKEKESHLGLHYIEVHPAITKAVMEEYGKGKEVRMENCDKHE